MTGYGMGFNSPSGSFNFLFFNTTDSGLKNITFASTIPNAGATHNIKKLTTPIAN